MTALIPFRNDEFELAVTPDGDSFRVQAPGLARALGFRQALDLTRTVPDSEKGYELVRTPGGEQRVGYVTEAGFYRCLGQRQAARVKDATIRAQVERFQSWVYGEVLPAIRRSGGYNTAPAPALSGKELLAAAVLEAAETIKQQEAQIAVQAEQLAIAGPKAEAFDMWLSSNVDYSVSAASQALVKAGVQNMGRNRLFGWLQVNKWIYRTQAGQLHPYQPRIERGHLSVRLGSQLNTTTGETFATTTVRVTPKGLTLLARRLGVAPALVAEAIQDEEGDVA